MLVSWHTSEGEWDIYSSLGQEWNIINIRRNIFVIPNNLIIQLSKTSHARSWWSRWCQNRYLRCIRLRKDELHANSFTAKSWLSYRRWLFQSDRSSIVKPDAMEANLTHGRWSCIKSNLNCSVNIHCRTWIWCNLQRFTCWFKRNRNRMKLISLSLIKQHT